MDECDVVVPREDRPKFVHRMLEIAEEVGVRIRSFGHAGDGNLHIYACRDDMEEAAWKAACEQVMDELYAAARAMGGEVSGEHGIGHATLELEAEGEHCHEVCCHVAPHAGHHHHHHHHHH